MEKFIQKEFDVLIQFSKQQLLMRTLLLIATGLILSLGMYAQENKSIKAVKVTDVSVLNSFGYLVSYTVTFKNTSSKTIDHIGWTVNYYDNSGKLVSSEESSFNSDSMVDPIVAGFEKTLVRTPRIKGASKAQIVVKEAHSPDGTKFK
jgi:hypothetical protein